MTTTSITAKAEHYTRKQLQWNLCGNNDPPPPALGKTTPCLERPFSHKWKFLSTIGINTNQYKLNLDGKTVLRDHFFLTSRVVVPDRFHRTSTTCLQRPLWSPPHQSIFNLIFLYKGHHFSLAGVAAVYRFDCIQGVFSMLVRFHFPSCCHVGKTCD